MRTEQDQPLRWFVRVSAAIVQLGLPMLMACSPAVRSTPQLALAPTSNANSTVSAKPKGAGWEDLGAWCERRSCAESADDAIAGALKALSDVGGGTLQLPAARYCVARPILVATDRITVRGSGKATVVESCLPSQQIAQAGAPGYLIQFSASEGGVQDITLACHNEPGMVTSALAVMPVGENRRLIHGDVFSGLRIEGCRGNGLEIRASSDGLTVFNVFRDIFITYTETGILLAAPAKGGSTNSNQFYSVTINNHVTTGIDIQAGASANSFFGCSFETIYGRSVNISRGAEDNHFFGTVFDNIAPGVPGLAVENAEPTTQFFGSVLIPGRIRDTGTMGSMVGTAGNDVRVGGYEYSSADGVVRLNSGGGVRLQTQLSMDPGKTLDVLGETNASLAVGGKVAPRRLGIPSLTLFHPPAANWGQAATFITDGVGRGVWIVSSGFDSEHALGTGLAISSTGLSATKAGTGAAAPVVIGGGSNLYTSTPGAGLVARSPDGTKCALIGVANDGKVGATIVPCP